MSGDGMKYIVMKDEEGKEELFTFPCSVHHDAMAEVLGRIKNHTHGDWHRIFRQPIAAGFISAGGQCYGKSETLKLSSRPEDSTLLARQFV